MNRAATNPEGRIASPEDDRTFAEKGGGWSQQGESPSADPRGTEYWFSPVRRTRTGTEEWH